MKPEVLWADVTWDSSYGDGFKHGFICALVLLAVAKPENSPDHLGIVPKVSSANAKITIWFRDVCVCRVGSAAHRGRRRLGPGRPGRSLFNTQTRALRSYPPASLVPLPVSLLVEPTVTQNSGAPCSAFCDIMKPLICENSRRTLRGRGAPELCARPAMPPPVAARPSSAQPGARR